MHMTRKHFALAGIGFLLFLLLIVQSSLGSAQAPLQVAFINIGQGDAALIMDGNGFEILIDGGKPEAGPTVVAFLRQREITDLEVMVASHADADHIGGLITVLQATDIAVGQVYYNGYAGTTNTWNTFGTAVASRGLTLQPAQFPQEITWGGTTANILGPASGLVNPETNDASVVILLTHGLNRFLFTGDIDSRIEATVVARGTPVASHILKVGHHGSASSSSAAFLAAVGARDAVISVGDNNYGHPVDDALLRLSDAGAAIWRTDQMGTIYVTSDGLTYTIIGTVPLAETIFLPFTFASYVHDQPPSTGNIIISSIFYDGLIGSTEPDEYVEIRNDDAHAIQIKGWKLHDNANTTFTFPSFLMEPGQVCRVYTNQVEPDWCGFTYSSGSAIWNNGGDCAFLKDSENKLVSQVCYP
jgi:competence protein ComEC